MPKINRCPCCGREPSEIILTGILDESQVPGYELECYDCGLHSGRCDAEDEAIKKWNELTNNQVTKKK